MFPNANFADKKDTLTIDALEPPQLTLDYVAKTAAPSAIPKPALPGYEIVREIGRGSMGVVYLANDVRLNRPVALKVVLAGIHAGSTELVRFLGEAEAVARLQHPNIVQIFETGKHDGLPYIAIEYVSGGDLADKVRQNPLPPVEAARLVIQLARGVGYAHEQGVVHRDLKPENVLLTAQEPPEPKVSDFGLAKFVGSGAGLTATGAVLGTPSYMAPEQAKGDNKAARPAVDIYSLGAILYRLVTGRAPFQAASVPETLLQVLNEEPVSPRVLQPNLPRDLETIILKTLHKDPARRYASATALADDLERFVSGRPVAARPVGRLERGWRWCKRNPTVAGLLGTTALLLVALAVGATASAARIAKERDRAAKLALAEAGARDDAEAATTKVTETLGRVELTLRKEAAARARADELAVENTRRLVRYYVSKGSHYLDDNDPWGAALWYAKAWQTDPDGELNDTAHRLRLAFVLARSPRLEKTFFHESSVYDAALSPDGAKLATIGDDTAVWLWDTRSGAPIDRLQHASYVTCAAWSPDGSRLATSCADGAKLWSGEGKPLANLHVGVGVRWVAIDPRGKFVATAGADKTVRLWNASDGQPVGDPLKQSAPAWYVAFGSGPERLLVGTEDAKARVWDATSGQSVGEAMKHDLSILDGRPYVVPERDKPFPALDTRRDRLVTYADGMHICREITTGIEVFKHKTPTGFFGAHLSPDGSRWAVLNLASIQILDGNNGSLLATLTLPRYGMQSAWHPDSKRLLASSSGGVIHLWDVNSQKELCPTLKHGVSSSRVGFTQDGSGVLVADLDGTARLWDLPGGFRPSGQYDHARDRPGLLFANVDLDSSRFIAPAPGGFIIKGFKNEMGPVRAQADNQDAQPTRALLNRDRTLALTGGAPAVTGVWDAHTGRAKLIAPPVSDSVEILVLSADDRLAAALTKAEMVVGDVVTGEWAKPLRHGLSSPFKACFAPDGKRLAVAASSRGFVLDAATGKRLASVGHIGAVVAVAFSPDGKWFATSSMDTIARVWDAGNGRPISPPLKHKRQTLTWMVEFHPNGRWLLTGGIDGSARLWDVVTGDPLGEIDIAARGIAWFDRAGEAIITWDGKSFARWPLPTLQLKRSDLALYLGLLTGQEIDATEGLANLPQELFRRRSADYERVWFASLGVAVPPRPVIASQRTRVLAPQDVTGAMLGQTVTVEMKVVIANNIGRICFLNFSKDWKGQFAVPIFEECFLDFPLPPEQLLINKKVRVTGRVTSYRGTPQIQVHDAAQIEIVE